MSKKKQYIIFVIYALFCFYGVFNLASLILPKGIDFLLWIILFPLLMYNGGSYILGIKKDNQ